MLVSERVRIEVFIPDLPDPAYAKLLTQWQTEFTYAFGGSTVLSASGTFLSTDGMIHADQINIIFADVDLDLTKDRLLIGQYTQRVRAAALEALEGVESILVSVHSVCHDK